jgi:outer membrane protein assembly factor BamB
LSVAVAVVGFLASAQVAGNLRAQLGRFGVGAAPGSRFELSETVRIDRADNTVRTALDRVEQYLADQQWQEAVDSLCEVMEQSGTKLLGVTDRRFVSVRDYCHLQLASLPPEALALYRSRVDPSARKWYEEGINGHDRRPLQEVVERAFSSRWGDDALYALGEMALESGDYATARSYWQKCLPVDPPADASPTWLCVPDTDLELAAVRARLVLASILEGSLDRAREELAAMSRLHPDARGRFGGVEVDYVEALSSLLAEAAAWPEPPAEPDWPTFGGSPLRNAVAPTCVDLAEVSWRVPLRPTVPASPSIWGSDTPTRRVAEDARAPLSYHPVLAGDLVLANNQVEIVAFDVHTGEPAWGAPDGRIYRDPFDEEVHALYNPPANLGVPRFTMTVFDGRLYARMGSAVTSRPREPEFARGSGYLVCLDLEAQGRLVWKIMPPEKGLSFEGSPVTDGADVYVAMRRSDIQPQAHVACFEASSGRLRWRQFLCAAETPARGMLHETTHNLLTLDRDTIYVNTNLGAVAAISARDGRVKWVSLYPRVLQGDLLKPAPHRCRDLNPCLYDRCSLLVASSDSRRIFALDAATGQILWQTGSEVEDVVHLLGVAGDTLIAGGDRLYWISLKAEEAGRVKHVWPLGHERLGYGRGVLAGDCVLWPTREKIYVFDQATGKQRKVIPLVPRGATGGNLLVAPGRLLIAGSEELVALRRAGAQREPQEEHGEGKKESDRVALQVALAGKGLRGPGRPLRVSRR